MLDGEDAAGGVRVVGQQVHEHLPAVGQDPEVVLGAGRQVGTGGCDVHADDAGRRRGAVRDRVRQVVGAGGVPVHRDCSRRRIHHGGDAGGNVVHRDEPERVRVGVGVVSHRRDRRGCAFTHDEVVGVCDRRLIGAFLDGDVNRAVARVAPVGHADRDRVLARRVPGIDDFNVAVFVGVHRHPRGGGRASQEEGVSVGVHPVRQPVDGGPTALTQGDGGHDLLHGRLVDVVAVDGQRHVGLRGSTPPIRDLVIEGRRARRVLVDGDLQGRTLAGDTHLAEGGLRER